MVAVLLVEPHDDTRTLYAEWLHEAGLRVQTATTAEAALKLAPAADVVITESRLPGPVDGFALIKQLRSIATTGHVPIVVVSASGTFAEARARTAGCDVFLAKPCLPAQLYRELRRLDRRRRGARVARADLPRSPRSKRRPA